MKTKNFSLALICAMCVSFASCSFGGLVKDLEKATQEMSEVLEGKLFLVKKGTVKYNRINNAGNVIGQITFTFDAYGKTWAASDGTETQMIKDGKYFNLDANEKTGYSFALTTESYGSCEYLFLENTLRFGDTADKYYEDSELEESTETIAGKKCVVFTDKDGDVAAGWNRVLFKDIDIEGDGIVATSWSDNVTTELFSTEGYTITEASYNY